MKGVTLPGDSPVPGVRAGRSVKNCLRAVFAPGRGTTTLVGDGWLPVHWLGPVAR